jgi:hypothetical protein
MRLSVPWILPKTGTSATVVLAETLTIFLAILTGADAISLTGIFVLNPTLHGLGG